MRYRAASPRAPMTVVLWILQAVLAAVFLGVGTLKLIKPKEALLGQMGALEAYRPLTIKALGLAEVLGGLGLVAAPLVGWAAMVPWAALGLGCVALGAAVAHAEQRDYKPLPAHAVLLAMAVAVMVGRSADLPL